MSAKGYKELTDPQKKILGNLRNDYPGKVLAQVFQHPKGGAPRRQIMASDGSAFFRIDEAVASDLPGWVAAHPLMGPGFRYDVQIFTEEPNGRPSAKPKLAIPLDEIVSADQAFLSTAPVRQQLLDTREQAARLMTETAAGEVLRVVNEEQQKVQEAMQMAASPDPTVQATAANALSSSADRMASAMTGLVQTMPSLMTALQTPRAGMNGAPLPAPVAAAPAPAPSMFGAAPQIMQVPGFGPMAMINGQLVPVSPAAPKSENSEVVTLLRAFIEKQNAPAQSAASAELQQMREQMAQLQRDNLKAQADAERRAMEAERKADQARFEAQLSALETKRTAELAALRAEFAGKSDANGGTMQFMAMMQAATDRHQQMIMQMQSEAANREARYQEQIQRQNDRTIEQLEASASQGPTQQMAEMSKMAGELINMSTSSALQMAKAAALQGAKDAPPPMWIGLAQKGLESVGAIANGLIAQGQQQQMQVDQQRAFEQQQYEQSMQQQALPPVEQQQPTPAPTQERPVAPPISLDNARAAQDASAAVDAARIACGQRRFADAFRALDTAFTKNPSLLSHGGDADDFQDLRAGQLLLAGYWPTPNPTESEIVTAFVEVRGAGVVGKLMAFKAAQEAAAAPADSDEEEAEEEGRS